MRRFLVMAAACGALVCGALAPSARADDPPTPDWKQLAYDETHTGFNPAQTAIGADNVGQLRLIWVKGPAQTIPLVEHGHVITCSAGSCYDRLLANGALVWKTQKRAHSQATTIGQGQLFSVGGLGRVMRLVLDDGSFAGSFGAPGGFASPVTFHAGRVFTSGLHGHLNAYDALTGALVWSSAKLFALGYPGGSGAVTVAYNRVFASSCGALIALREDNGRFRWVATLPGDTAFECGSLPAASAGSVFVTTSQVAAFDAKTGQTRWTAPGDGGRLSRPAVAYGRVFAVSVTGATLAAYDAVDGRRVWTSPTQGAGAPTVANGVVYVVGATGVQAYDPSTGRLLATITGQFSGEAVLAEGSLVVACQTAAVGRGMCVYRP